MTGIQIKNQKLEYNGKSLDIDATLEKNSLSKESIIWLYEIGKGKDKEHL